MLLASWSTLLAGMVHNSNGPKSINSRTQGNENTNGNGSTSGSSKPTKHQQRSAVTAAVQQHFPTKQHKTKKSSLRHFDYIIAGQNDVTVHLFFFLLVFNVSISVIIQYAMCIRSVILQHHNQLNYKYYKPIDLSSAVEKKYASFS